MAGRDTSTSCWRPADEEVIRGDGASTRGRRAGPGSLGERPLRHSLNRQWFVPPNVYAPDARTTRTGSNQQKLLIAAYPSLDQAGSHSGADCRPAKGSFPSRRTKVVDDVHAPRVTISCRVPPDLAREVQRLAESGTGQPRERSRPRSPNTSPRRKLQPGPRRNFHLRQRPALRRPEAPPLPRRLRLLRRSPRRDRLLRRP